ncbi:MAG: MFS transporter [Carnobacterium sp.]|uniref:MFS transporter n=1 Tax=Carnobacterium sp. TaxID=48221 RepID=UPI003315CB22
MKKSKVFYGWWIVLGAAIVLAVMGPASVAVANLFQLPVTEEFGISNSQFAISNSLVLGVGIFLSPIISKKLATGNFRLIYSIAVIVYALAYMGFGFAPNIYVFYLLSLLVGFGYTTTTIIPVSMLMNNWFVKKRGLALSLSLSGLGIGGVIFSQILTPLINNVGWRQTYLIYGVIMLVVTLPIVLFVFKPRPELMNLKAYGTEELNVSNKGDKEQTQAKRKQATGTKTGITPFFILLMLGAVLVGLVNNGGLGQFPPVLNSLHGATQGALIISIYSAVGIAGKIILGNINDRYGTVASTIYASVLLVLTYLVMIFAGNFVLAIIMAILFGLGNAIGTVSPPLITSAIYSADDFPKAYGYVQSGVQLGMTVGSLVAASIADFTGTYTVSWIFLAIASALVGLSWVAAYRTSQKHV